jgi:hypothetical protein
MPSYQLASQNIIPAQSENIAQNAQCRRELAVINF